LKKYLIDPALSQFKGQLHIHTKTSDGRLTQQESFEKYKAQGYNFLAFTEHNKLTYSEIRDGVLILSGVETDCNIMEPLNRAAYHIVGVGMDTEKYVAAQRPATPQQLIDALKAAGGFVIAAHPAWSLIQAEELYPLENYDAIEVMNWVSQVRHQRGDSSQQLDKLMSRGVPKLMVANDDVHYYEEDFAGTATIAVCEKLENDCVLNALKAGSMYATCGPRIKSLYAENGELHVECSDAGKIYFISDCFFTDYEKSLRWHFADEKPLNGAVYTPHKNDTHVRVEIIDKNGNKAWSQYISANLINETK